MPERSQPQADIFFHHLDAKASINLLSEYWRSLPLDNWLDYSFTPILVRPSTRFKDDIVKGTAISLVEFINSEKGEGTAIFIEEGQLNHTSFGTAQVSRDNGMSPRLSLRSCCLRDGVSIDRSWLKPFNLITVSGVRPDNHSLITGILEAQAELVELPAHLQRAMRYESIYEAHRLVRSDIGIICGPVHYNKGNVQSEIFWATSNNDLSLENFFFNAAGISVKQSPVFKTIRRHALIDLENYRVHGETRRISGYQVNQIIFRINLLIDAVIRSLSLSYDEWIRLVQNADRIKKAIVKRIKGEGQD